MADQRTDDIVRRDTETLHKFGYAQELSRRMSGFGNFALSFMIIGLFWAVCINIQQGFSSAGMLGITGVWLVGCVIAVATAASLGEISSAIPTAGGLYHWSSVLGGRGWGWGTAWINLLAYTFAVAGSDVAVYLLFNQMALGWVFHIDTSSWGYWHQVAGVAIILASQAALNHMGVRMLARIGEFGAYVTLAGAALLIGVMLFSIHPANIAHLFDYTNYTGEAGGGIVPKTGNGILVFGYALLLPMWIITAYDASAHTSEETIDAARSVPKAMINSALLSAGLGFAMLVVLALAMRDPGAIAKEGGNAFSTLFDQSAAPPLVKDFISVAMVLAAYICGAVGLTGFSRATFAFSRDRGLPVALRRVSHRFRTPAPAIWTCAIVCLLVTLYSSAFAALAAGTALFYQLCYGMAILAAMFARNRTYGPFRLGILSKPLGVIAVLGGVFIVWVGLQPPTAILISYFIGILVLLLVGWFGFEKRRFPGPPTTDSAIRDRQHEIMREEEAISGA
ncbi:MULTISPECIES: APC family permease [unclassified Acidisoma]|jgi:amino acid transporter|uniref:APC family permease n=1 Tax=unclassified Acidisoma TaxID=2634065 RepID=UPI00131A6442|nr:MULTISPECIES: amino acid permease [unclassified Acidisoma]